MENNSPQSAVLGASGEYLILSNLLRLNFVAGKAPDNTKDYDLIVLNKSGTSSSPIPSLQPTVCGLVPIQIL